MIKILFVCHGNICRSTMAQCVMSDIVKKEGCDDQFIIDSCATSREEIGNGIHYGTRYELKKHNIEIIAHQARQIDITDAEKFDYIIGMDEANMRNLKRMLPCVYHAKLYKLLDDHDVADPWYTDNFEETYRDVLEGCMNWYRFLMKE